jgi:hypothetical protein
MPNFLVIDHLRGQDMCQNMGLGLLRPPVEAPRFRRLRFGATAVYISPARRRKVKARAPSGRTFMALAFLWTFILYF